ncbi:glycosyltransferase family 4 protein [Ramlibacter solisilvae]|uniref:glycosyltransferase family 4 protein n=1 Tax=Ramlibacter tataouinensis TaxID=94132 RepID=UPI00077718CB|nr:glycosyltransferase family 4 protein [Ramlibacter tataouinensis]
MNIVIVASLYAPHGGGGAELVAQNQAEGFAARGHTVHVLTLGEPGSGTQHTTLNGVHVIRIGIRNLYLPFTSHPSAWTRVAWHTRDIYNAPAAQLACAQLAELRPDIVVCHNVYGWSAAIWRAIKSQGLPIVQVLHDQYLRCVRSNMFKDQRCVTPCASCRLVRLPHRGLSRLPDAVVGVSRYVIDSHIEDGFFQSVPVRTHIHNASHLDTRSRPTPPLDVPDIVYGFIGTLTANKGIEPLLSAFHSVARPHWRLRVAGTGPPGFVERLRADHADSRIEFLGRQDPASFYLGLDATVVPSLWNDTFPSVVFESLIHGRPVIGARRGGIPEIVEDGLSGILYEPDDTEGLEGALVRFAADIRGWRSRQAAIKALSAPRYCDREDWITRWESLCRQVIEDAPGTPTRSQVSGQPPDGKRL